LARNTLAIAFGLDLDQGQLPQHRRFGLEVGDLHHLHQLGQLLDHLLQDLVVAADHDRDPGEFRVDGRAHGQALDVVGAGGKQPADPGEDARVVLDQDGYGVAHRRAPAAQVLGC
jgi:hypothetical protein